MGRQFKQKFGWKIQKEDLCVDGRIILEKYGVTLQIEFIWLKIGTSGRLLWPW